MIREQLKQILPAAGKIAPVEHHAALPYVQMPAFFQCVQQTNGVGARALEFAALTVGRTGMTLGAMWSEVDLEEGIWTVPAERMKGKREFRMPLSKPALSLSGRWQTYE